MITAHLKFKAQLKKVAYFTVFLLFLNSGLSTAAYTISNKAEDGSELILLCTSQGFKWVSLSELNASANGDSHSTSGLTPSQHCPFCSINVYSIDNSLDNTALTIGLNPCYKQLQRVDLIDSTLHQHYRISNLPSRAPPAIS